MSTTPIPTEPGELPTLWAEPHMLAWRGFLFSEAGRALLVNLVAQAPTLLPGGNTNDVLIRSGEVRGWGAAISALQSLAAPAPKPNGGADMMYPPLDDDDQWNKPAEPPK